ncbi:MAG: DUF3754 domain-containing protein [Candidatus Melainabacteria bacterium HGW-Melainabacteria-1]|nr:MAG: DUF3754 domain-containing protein [Candidatus Melainabacteria bacterium HGW-Melainabacteria-1]
MSSPEAFIPFSRRDLLRLILADRDFAAAHEETFRSFCRLLEAWLHHTYHSRLEDLKSNFAHLDPDRDTLVREQPDANTIQAREAELIGHLRWILGRANYRSLSQEQLDAALVGRSLIDLDLRIDFDDFEQMLFYWRGAERLALPPAPKWKFWRKPGDMDVFQRVMLLIRFKDADYFAAQNRRVEQLGFTPGKMYLYLYKQIPKLDLEVLFPNVEIHMTLKDRLLFAVPALGAAVPMVLKALPQLMLVVGVLLFFSLGPDAVKGLGLSGAQIGNFLPVLLALLSLAVVFGGFAVKQYLGYKNKQLKFLKDVTDTLFFRNLVSNAGVFHALVDSAEEEEAKEIMLAAYHLLSADRPLTAEALDQQIEAWLAGQGAKVDFDVAKALLTMEAIESDGLRLLERRDGSLQMLPPQRACALLDQIWDQLYDYSVPLTET